jgi:hypothetical protein
VSPDRITKVEVWEGDAYRTVSGTELTQLVAQIEKERDAKLEIRTIESGILAGSPLITLKDGIAESWLLE